MHAAVEGFSTGIRNIVLIMGGQSKGADFSKLGLLCEKEVRRCFIYGQDRNEIAAAIGVDGMICTTLAEVVARLPAEIRSGDLVLFSPACASFDQFENYKERGLAFSHAVELIQQGEVNS